MWNRLYGRLPPIQVMVGKYLGFKIDEDQPAKPRTMEEAAEELMRGLTGGMTMRR